MRNIQKLDAFLPGSSGFFYKATKVERRQRYLYLCRLKSFECTGIFVGLTPIWVQLSSRRGMVPSSSGNHHYEEVECGKAI